MINRTNEFVYVKRHYFFPFKPLMDWEYKKFGYKKCDSDKGKNGIFNTAYYVRHKERPMGACDALYYINLPFSVFRAILCPFLLAVWLLSMLIEGTLGGDLLLAEQMLVLFLVFPAAIISTILGNFGYNLYRNNDTDGKLDRIMNSRGWPAWTSYRDNDSRFAPPCSKTSSQKANSAPQKSGNTGRNAINKNVVNANPAHNTTDVDPDDDDNDVISLITANGEEVRFVTIAVIAHKGLLYAILQPEELIEGMEDDEALVFRVSKTADGSDSFEIETDDDIINAVFGEYDRLYEESH